MRKLIFLFLLIPSLAWCQKDTALVSFKKIFRWRPLPFDATYNNKEFQMDSLWNSVENNGYIKYRSEIKPKPANQFIPKYLSKRFLKMDTIMFKENGDTLHADFYALGYFANIKDVFCFLVERQFAGKVYRMSEKYLVTFDKKYKIIDKILLSHEIPGAANAENFDVFNDSFNESTWFEESYGIIREDLSIELENEIGKITNYKIKDNGKIVKSKFKNLNEILH